MQLVLKPYSCRVNQLFIMGVLIINWIKVYVRIYKTMGGLIKKAFEKYMPLKLIILSVFCSERGICELKREFTKGGSLCLHKTGEIR